MEAERKLITPGIVSRRDSGLVMLRGEGGIARVYVPLQRREAVMEAHHVAIKHLGPDKNYASLHRNYIWPTMRKDVRELCTDCRFCELSKARRNQAHRQWGAVTGGPPGSRWGMDFYGVQGGYVLGHIDLDALHVKLQHTVERTALTVKRSVKRNILNRHGKFDELRSDHAREFVGQVMTMLSKEAGYILSSTGGYSATGNATMEHFWAFLGLCLRQMTDKQYEHFDEHLQDIAWAWNTTPKESLGGISPFNIYTGTRPRMLVGSAMDHGPTSVTIDMNSIRVAAAEFT